MQYLYPRGLLVFDKRFRPKLYTRQKGEYNLSLPISAEWDDKPQRVMLVLETIDSQDLKEETLLFDRSRAVLTNLMKYTFSASKVAFGFKRKEAGFCAVNFNNKKFMDQPKETWGGYRSQFAKRVKMLIKEMQPTHVIIFGDYAAASLLPDIEYLDKKRGWVFDTKLGGVQVKVCATLDLQPLYTPKKNIEDDGDDDDDDDGGDDKDIYGAANLLLYVSNNVMNGLAGKNLYDLSHIKPNVKYIDTIEKFDKFYAKLKEAEVAGVDTETRNGTINHNAIHTLQVAFSENKSYFIPIDHPEAKWDEDERKYVKKKLRTFFGAPKGKYPLKYMITQWGMFDLRMLRVELGIPVIHHDVWEITAGEYCLDENKKYLADKKARGFIKTPHGGLEQIFMYYGNDHYKTSPFGKGDRANPNLTRLSNPDFIDYGGMDVQSIFGIHLKQQERASHLSVGDKPFLPFFKRLVTKQMSNTVHTISHMKQKGVAVDKLYLATLKSNQSPLLKIMNDIKAKLNGMKEVEAANKKLLKNSSGQSTAKGLYDKTPWIFNWNKADHKEVLFFNVMGLKPVSYTRKENKPQVNKTFIAEYKRENEVVETFGRYQKLSKLWSAYVKGFWNRIQESVDSKADFRLRPDYGFLDVVTGRLNSGKPSLQQVPTRGAESKYIKRMFTSPPGTMHIKFDYSAHEVRVWSYVSGEKLLADVFRVGQTLRKQLRVVTDPDKLKELFTKIKVEGDIHIINVKRFLNQVVDKEHPLRDAIKSVVFGVLYGKGAGTLAKDIVSNNTNTANDKIDKIAKEVKELKDKLNALKGKELTDAKAKIVELTRQRSALEEEKEKIPKKYTKDFASDIIQRLFGDFKKGAKWLDWTKQHAREHFYTYSPLGMRRNLFSMLTGINSIIAAMERRAANSPIQGMASQIGVTAARLFVLELYKVLKEFGYIDKKTREMPAEILKAVHDALYSEVPYKIVLIYVHVLQWVATYGVTEYYKEEFGVEFPIEPEIELEFGASEDKAYKWNWTDSHLKECLLNTLKDQKSIGVLKEDPEEILKLIYSVYDDAEQRAYLEKHYPILGVHSKEKVTNAERKQPKSKSKEAA
jgi:DNA polymerase I-like protein with 3'-5' exonuclease and polymerase domains